MTMRVEDLSRRTGIAGNTIRYYTRIGLLRPRRQSSNGYRLFSENDTGASTLSQNSIRYWPTGLP